MRSRYSCAVDGHDFDDHRTFEFATRTDPGTAARLYAADLCDGDPDWYSHFERGARVRVRNEDTGSETWWVVGFEAVPDWHVHRHPDRVPTVQTTDGTSEKEGQE